MPSYLELEVTLKGVRPAVRRRFLLPVEARVSDLCEALREAFGWRGGRAFEVYPDRPGEPPLLGGEGRPDPSRVPLLELLGGAVRSIVVVYDPEVWWEHVVTLKRHRDLPAAFLRRLTGARGVAPPEACGGLAGYAAWLEQQGGSATLDLDELRSTFEA